MSQFACTSVVNVESNDITDAAMETQIAQYHMWVCGKSLSEWHAGQESLLPSQKYERSRSSFTPKSSSESGSDCEA